MCGNRVDELEEQVNQLQATVDGLTDELVECKVRIRELEGENEGVAADPDTAPEPPEEADEPVADNSNTEAAEDTDEEESDSDIIIA